MLVVPLDSTQRRQQPPRTPDPSNGAVFRPLLVPTQWTNGCAPGRRAAGMILTASFPLPKPTVSLSVISLVVSSCGYYKGQIDHRVAHEFAVHVATQRGLVERAQHRHPLRAQAVAPMRECHCRRPWLTPRSCTDQAPYCDQG